MVYIMIFDLSTVVYASFLLLLLIKKIKVVARKFVTNAVNTLTLILYAYVINRLIVYAMCLE